MSRRGVRLRIEGRVQGVGFRPTVYRVARSLGLTGDVQNDGRGVTVRLYGDRDRLAAFEPELRAALPALATIDSWAREELTGGDVPPAFVIADSGFGEITSSVVPDAATCPDCLAEISDPRDRRYRYPFTTCIACGPRFSIATGIPFDRERTTMVRFPMCDACRAEYEDPLDRRYHAQAQACPACGPIVWLVRSAGDAAHDEGEAALQGAVAAIRTGDIVAIKGLGGFHLACDARNETAVAQLREHKHRDAKPFALMARDLAIVERYADPGATERDLLNSPETPIVLLPQRENGPSLAGAIAPDQDRLGFMLPGTPLHHLLLAPFDHPLVMTSGNVSDEPQITDNDVALQRLIGIADTWLLHDRPIAQRVDDSVVTMVAGAPAILRRGRGHATGAITLPPGFDTSTQALAMGAELKSTFAFTKAGRVTVSQHIGDLEDAAAFADYRSAIDRLLHLFDVAPDLIVTDLHPDYGSTVWGAQLAERWCAKLIGVQHHHAHVASALAEHGVPADAEPVLGIVLDGLGLGEKGDLRGAEFLSADYRTCERLAAFQTMPLIGGARAMREPWRNAFAWLDGLFGLEQVAERWPDLDILKLLDEHRPDLLRRMVERGANAPPASSAGRLFDAVAAVLGLHRQRQSHEAQAAMALETMARRSDDTNSPYPAIMHGGAPATIDFTSFWEALLDDLQRGAAQADIAARFHAGLATLLADTAVSLATDHELATIVLSGGVFQNRLLAECVHERLTDAGFTVLLPRAYPANDGGLSLGQLAIALAGNG